MKAERKRLTYADGTTPRVCIVGAGVAGLCAAVQLKRKLNLPNFVVYERGGDVGGVWLANTYPGCQVDVPAWIYSYSFAQSGGWSKLYPDRDEILAYFQSVARKYDIYAHIQFNTEVCSAVWNEASAKWTVTTITREKGAIRDQVEEFDVVILGTGTLREPNRPAVFDTFAGPKMHSAEWDPNLQLEGRVVGVVGSGSSAVQVIPGIAPKVKKLIVYMREPTYVGVKIQLKMGRLVRAILGWFPFLLWLLRTISFFVFEFIERSYNSGSVVGHVTRALWWAHFSWNVKDKRVREQLTPSYPLGYKVPPVAYGYYYQSFNRANVQLVKSRVRQCDGTTVTTEDGRTEVLDALILCTGFKVRDFFAPVRVLGIGGVDLLKKWKESRPETFYGITCHEAPNLFFLLGPNGNPGFTVTFMAECQVDFAIRALRAMMAQNATTVRVTTGAVAKCMADIDATARKKVYMQRAAGDGDGPSWLLNENGFPIVWPGSNTSYWLRTRRLDLANFEFTGRRIEMAEGEDEPVVVISRL